MKASRAGTGLKLAALAFAVILLVALFFYPLVPALGEWLTHRHSTFGQNQIELPPLWEEEHEGGRDGDYWVRPRPNAFSPFDDAVRVMRLRHPLTTPDQMVRWHQIYGYLAASDLASQPLFGKLADEGITCGKLRSRADNDQVAVACLSPDKSVTLTYSGSDGQLRAGLEIISQALQ